MSDRKRKRAGECKMCGDIAAIVQHGKCENCRIVLHMERYRMKGKRLGVPKDFASTVRKLGTREGG